MSVGLPNQGTDSDESRNAELTVFRLRKMREEGWLLIKARVTITRSRDRERGKNGYGKKAGRDEWHTEKRQKRKEV